MSDCKTKEEINTIFLIFCNISSSSNLFEVYVHWTCQADILKIG